MRLSIIGSGNVGKATGIGFQIHGNEVIFYDIDEKKLSALKKDGYTIARNVTDAINKSEISFICVPTPTINGQMDLSYIEKASMSVAKALGKKKEYHLIVIRSTVLPSTTRMRVIPLLEKISQLKSGRSFGVCVNPEFLRQVNALKDFLNPSRIVIGELDRRSGEILEKLYSPFEAMIFRTNLDNAEMVKCVANSFLATKISFFNEMYLICKDVGLDPHFIAHVVAKDSRIGDYGTYGGRPFMGKCLPKDLDAFMSFIESKQHNPKILKATRLVNETIARKQNDER